jgi:hypothetical protein
LLSRRGALPLLRVQPLHFQGTVEATWNPILAQLAQRRDLSLAPAAAPISQTAMHA